ncbi:MAG TPA: glycosyltransferase [Casimicrobiaceae bacterium]|nr:glycosyltransferase [Casimicrobiaceae bacterium]
MALQVILAPVGTTGDVLPFVAIALRLKERGHRIVVAASGGHRSMLDAAGVEMIETLDEKADAAALDHPNFWRPTRGLRRFTERMILPSIRPQVAAIEARAERGKTVIVGSTFAFGARIASEKFGLPIVSIHLAPAAMRSLDDTPAVANIPAFPRLPRSTKRLLYWYFDRFVFDPVMGPGLNEIRRSFGLAPITRPLQSWLHSPTRVIGLFPPWFAAPAPDWPPQVRLTGFPLYDGPASRSMPPELRRFLKEGTAPIVFTAGTAMSHGDSFYRAAVEACDRLRMRGVLISAAKKQLPAETPPTVRAFAYAPFSELLPRAKAIVHHGGIGTAAQALKAGVAQIVVPMAYDQPDNSARLVRLGVASMLSQRRLDGASLAATLQRLLARTDLSAKLAEASHRFDGDHSLDETCRLIEEAAVH